MYKILVTRMYIKVDILNNSGDSLAKTQIKRNFDELMYHCHKEGSGCELNYKNEDIN